MTLNVANLFDEEEEFIVSDDMLVSDEETPNPQECYSMATGEFEVPNTGDPTTGTIIKEDGKNAPVAQRKKDGTTMANLFVVSAIKLEVLLIAVLARRFKHFSAALGLSDDFKLMLVHSKTLENGDFPERPVDKPLRVFDLERNGYRFAFDPEGDTSESSLTKRRVAAGVESPLLFLVNESGILNEDPSVKLIVDAVLTNTGKHGNMSKKVAIELLEQASEREYLKTEFTTRDLKVFVDTVEATYPNNTAFAWKMAQRIMKRTLEAAKTLYAMDNGATAKMSFVMIPELTGLDKDERACAELVFMKHDELFREGYTRLEMEEVNPWRHDALVETVEGASTVPHLADVRGAEFQGPVILRGFENDRDHPTYRLMSKAVRRAITEETHHTSLQHAPRLVASFSAPGKVFLQSDAEEGREIDLTPFVVALRVAEIQARKDLSSATKSKLLTDDALLSSVDAPEYVRGKKSHIILSKSRLQCGNDFDAISPALAISNAEIWDILVKVIETSRGPKTK